MADYAAFSHGEFTVSGWINAIMKGRSEEEALESFLAQHAMKLHIISQDYTDQLETGMIEAMSSMPRIMSEIGRTEETLLSVQQEMDSIGSQITLLDHRNVAGVDDLSRLDILKSNLEECKGMLQEHARWSQVVREARTFLDSGGRLSDSADRVEAMSRSLSVLQHLPGHEERQHTCNELAEVLLSAVRPRLSQEIIANDIPRLHEILYVYKKLDRFAEFEMDYVAVKSESLRETWKGYAKTSDFFHFYASFLSRLAEAFDVEAELCLKLFGSEKRGVVLDRLLEETLSPMQESLADKFHQLSSPALILGCFDLSNKFSVHILRNFDASCDVNTLGSMLTSIFGGYLAFMDDYVSVEEKWLNHQIIEAISEVSLDSCTRSSLEYSENKLDELEPREVLETFAEHLVQASETACGYVDSTLGRGSQFLSGLCMKPVMRILNGSVNQAIKQLIGRVEDVRLSTGCSLNSTGTNAGESGSRTSTPLKPVSGAASQSPQVIKPQHQQLARKFAEEVIDPIALIPTALKTLQVAGRFVKRLRATDVLAQKAFVELHAALFQDSALPISRALFSTGEGNSFAPSRHFEIFWLQENPNDASELRAYLNAPISAHSSHSPLFSGCTSGLSRLKASCGSLLFDLCMNVPEKLIAEYHHDDSWTKSAPASGHYSLLPLTTMTQVGEHMLALVQELESFVSSDAIFDLIYFLGESPGLVIQSRGWRKLKELLELPREDESISQLIRRKSCSALVANVEISLFGPRDTESHLSTEETVESKGDDLQDLFGSDVLDREAAALAFVNEWLGAIADAILALLLIQIQSIPKFSLFGRQQLRADLEYLGNVLNAVGIKPHPLLLHINHLLAFSPETLESILERLSRTQNGSAATALRYLDDRLLRSMF